MRQPTNDFNNRERSNAEAIQAADHEIYRSQEEVDAAVDRLYAVKPKRTIKQLLDGMFTRAALDDLLLYGIGGPRIGDMLFPNFEPVYPRLTIDRLPTRSGKTAAMMESFRDEMERYSYPEIRRREEVIRDLDRSSPVSGAMLEKAKRDLLEFRPNPEPPLIFYDEATILPPGVRDLYYYGRKKRPPARRLFRGHPDGPPEVFHIIDKIDYQRSW